MVREAAVTNAERGEYRASALARHLGTSMRSLQRLTRSHGPPVAAIIEELRETQARALLRDRQLSVEEIAFLLGYADDRAFRRAFRRWTGQSPVEARRGASGVVDTKQMHPFHTLAGRIKLR